MQSAAIIIETERAPAWLTSLDPAAAARRELLAAGVPEATVLNLYPVTFEAIVPGLIDRLAAHAASPVAVSRDELGALTRLLLPVLNEEPHRSAYRSRYAAARHSAPWYEPLVATLNAAISEDQSQRVEARALVEILWYAWHFTVEPLELPAGERQAVRQVLGWYGEQLFGMSGGEEVDEDWQQSR